ncbi:MAG: hypothetical protein M1816_003172 [Peltula sp. TS41687]|nr:MAG: hypothetical protein M1816_003172 [Peltula sp. TS41687]
MEPMDFQIFSSLRYDPLLLQNADNSTLSGCQRDTPSPFYMPRYHRDRLLEAARHFQWKEVSSCLEGEDGLGRFERDLVDKLNQIHAAGTEQGGPFKIRAVYAESGDLEIDVMPAQPVSVECLFPRVLSCNDDDDVLGGSLGQQGRQTSLNNDAGVIDGSLCRSIMPKLWCVLVDTRPTSPSPFTTFKTTYRDMYNEARARVGIRSYQDPFEVLLVNTQGEIMEGSLTSVYFLRGGRWVTPPLTSGGQAGTTRRWLLEQRLCQEEVIRADSVLDGERCFLSNGVRGTFPGRMQLHSA